MTSNLEQQRYKMTHKSFLSLTYSKCYNFIEELQGRSNVPSQGKQQLYVQQNDRMSNKI